jgi:aminoglycoside phosphotransferase (APT) family kinase protein
MQQIRMLPTHLPGMMRRAELVEYYCARAGIQPVRFEFYYVYGLFRLAVIVQQIYYRFVLGQTKNPRFAPFGRSAACCPRPPLSVTKGEAPF